MRRQEDVIGKTLEEILKEDLAKSTLPLWVTGLLQITAGLKVTPVSVHVLDGADDELGMPYAEEFTLRQILRDHPELRQAKVEHYNDFFGEDVFAGMIAKKSGYTNTDEILLMIRVMKDMNKAAEETGDWQTVYPSAVMRWAQHRKYKDIITAARSTILPNASKNLETQKEIMDSIFNNYW